MQELKMSEESAGTVVIENAQSIGKMSNSRSSRPIVACFSSIQDKIWVLCHSKKSRPFKEFLCGGAIPPEVNDRKRKLWPIYKKAKKKQ